MPDSSTTAENTPAAPATTLGESRVRVLAGWKKWAALLGSQLMRVWARTLRITVSDTSRRMLGADSKPVLFVCWHNRLFVIAEAVRLFRPGRPLHCLVSSSKDGAWLSEFFGHLGLRAVRGSSSRGGREAVTELLRLLRTDQDVGITPDGPRGPAYKCKPGAIVVARRGGARVILLGAAFESAWRTRGWDGFYLPRPFSRVYLLIGQISEEDLHADDALARLEGLLCKLSPDRPDGELRVN